MGAWIQVDSVEDADALVSFLRLPHVFKVVEKHGSLQDTIFAKLHSWSRRLIDNEDPSIEVVNAYLKACLVCALPHQLPALYHTWALAALAGGHLQLSLEHVNSLLESCKAAPYESPQAATDQSIKQMAGHLLKFKVLCMV